MAFSITGDVKINGVSSAIQSINQLSNAVRSNANTLRSAGTETSSTSSYIKALTSNLTAANSAYEAAKTKVKSLSDAYDTAKLAVSKAQNEVSNATKGTLAYTTASEKLRVAQNEQLNVQGKLHTALQEQANAASAVTKAQEALHSATKDTTAAETEANSSTNLAAMSAKAGLVLGIASAVVKVGEAWAEAAVQMMSYELKATAMVAQLNLATGQQMFTMAQGASDLLEAYNVASATFGSENLSSIESWAQSMLATGGIAEQTAANYLGQLGSMITGQGVQSAIGTQGTLSVTQQLVESISDLASFTNMDYDQVFNAISGVVTGGNIAGLKKLGFAPQQGNIEEWSKTADWASLSDQLGVDLSGLADFSFSNGTSDQDALIRAAYIIDQINARNISGDFARTIDTLANQQRVFEQAAINISDSLGLLWYDGFSNFLSGGSEILLDFSSALTKATAEWSVASSELDRIAGEGSAQKVYDSFKNFYDGFTDTYSEDRLTKWANRASEAVEELVQDGMEFNTAWGQVTNFLDGDMATAFDFTVGKIHYTQENLEKWFDNIKQGTRDAGKSWSDLTAEEQAYYSQQMLSTGLMQERFEDALTAVKSFISNAVAYIKGNGPEIIRMVTDVVTDVVTALNDPVLLSGVADMARTLVDTLKTQLETQAQPLGHFIGEMVEIAMDLAKAFIKPALDIGETIIISIAEGITGSEYASLGAALGDLVHEALSFVAESGIADEFASALGEVLATAAYAVLPDWMAEMFGITRPEDLEAARGYGMTIGGKTVEGLREPLTGEAVEFMQDQSLYLAEEFNNGLTVGTMSQNALAPWFNAAKEFLGNDVVNMADDQGNWIGVTLTDAVNYSMENGFTTTAEILNSGFVIPTDAAFTTTKEMSIATANGMAEGLTGIIFEMATGYGDIMAQIPVTTREDLEAANVAVEDMVPIIADNGMFLGYSTRQALFDQLSIMVADTNVQLSDMQTTFGERFSNMSQTSQTEANTIARILQAAGQDWKSSLQITGDGLVSITNDAFQQLPPTAQTYLQQVGYKFDSASGTWSASGYAAGVAGANSAAQGISAGTTNAQAAAQSLNNQVSSTLGAPMTVTKRVNVVVNAVASGIGNALSFLGLASGGILPSGLSGFIPPNAVTWHADGAIIDRATLVGSAAGRAIGVGEAGPEAVVPVSRLKSDIWEAAYSGINRALRPDNSGIERRLDALLAKDQTVVLDSGQLVGGIVDKMETRLNQRTSLRGKGAIR